MPARGRDSHDRLSLDCTLSEQNAQRLYYSLVEAARADGLEFLTAEGPLPGTLWPERFCGLKATRKTKK